MVESKILDGRRDSEPIGGDRYCPECGQSLCLTASISPHLRPRHSSWWGLVAIAVGLYLLVRYGLRTWNASSAEQSVAVASVGMVTILVGVGSLVRRRLRAKPGGWLAAMGVDCWALVENFFLTLVCLALGGYGFLLARELTAGSPLTWNVATQVSDHFFEILSDTTRFVALEFSVPHCPCSR